MVGGSNMICEKCKNEHDGTYGSGRFCSPTCARSFSSKNEEGKTKDAICILCGKETTIPKRASVKYAKCEKCKSRPKKIKYKFCLACGKKLIRTVKTYCNNSCQLNYQHQQYIERWKQGLEDGIRKPYKTSLYIHKYIKEKYDNKCAICGWCEVNETTGNVPLQLEHIDGHWDNNDEENLTLLCPNCHSLTSTYGSLNKGNGRPKNWYIGINI